MPKAYLDKIFGYTLDAYRRNGKLILFFSVPFLVVTPLLFFLPNFASLGGLFLRFDSLPANLDVSQFGFIAAAFLASLVLASFAISAINIVLRSQRTLTRLTHFEVQRIEHATFKLFLVFLTASVVMLAANVLLLNSQIQFGTQAVPLQPLLGSLIAFLVSGAVLFAPQAIAVDDAPLSEAVIRSTRFMFRKPFLFLSFLIIASILLVANDALFLAIVPDGARLATLLVNGFLIVPFLEVLKTHVYLAKYELI